MVVYFLLSWRTLRKHNKYNIKDEVEAVGGEDYDLTENQDPYLASLSMSSLASSREQLVYQDKVHSTLHNHMHTCMDTWYSTAVVYTTACVKIQSFTTINLVGLKSMSYGLNNACLLYCCFVVCCFVVFRSSTVNIPLEIPSCLWA